MSAATMRFPARWIGSGGESVLARLRSSLMDIAIAGPYDKRRCEVEAQIAAIFHGAYGAHVHEFMPALLNLQCLGRPSGVIGLRAASDGQLFLEQYLNDSVEDVLTARASIATERKLIAEVGNLVSTRRGLGPIMLLLAALVLHRAGLQWVVFTATGTLRRSLERTGFSMLELCDADPTRLGSASAAGWGSYYESEPKVMAGRMDDAIRLIEQHRGLREISRLYEARIDALVEEFRKLGSRAH